MSIVVYIPPEDAQKPATSCKDLAKEGTNHSSQTILQALKPYAPKVHNKIFSRILQIRGLFKKCSISSKSKLPKIRPSTSKGEEIDLM